MNKNYVVLALLFASLQFGFSQDSLKVQKLEEVVVTDSRFKLKRENSGKTIVKITKTELEQNKGKTVAEIINSKSGIVINGNQSQAGLPLSTFVRGGQNRQVLVLVDGIAISDPSQIENNFDLQLLAIDQIESIEILKGASSALYGNRASTAVINITLKKASKEKINASFSSFLGTNNSQEKSRIDVRDFYNSVGLNGSLNKLSYLANFSHKYTDGLSALKSIDDTEFDEDLFSRVNGNVKLGYNFSDKLSVSAFGTFDKYKTNYDDSFMFSDADYWSHNKQYRFGVSPKFSYKNGEFTVNTAINNVEREYESSFPAKFEAKTVTIDAFNKYKFNENILTVLGFNYVKTDMDSYSIPFGGTDFANDINSDTATDEIIDPYANITYLSDFGLNVNGGVRLNNHSEYGSHFVYNLNPSYSFKVKGFDAKVLASVSTAYITPSLYQLFAPGFGNDELNPQEDRTIEAGIEFGKDERFNVSAIYFNRQQDQFIDYVVLDFTTFAGEYQNIDEDYTTQGVEVVADVRLTNKINLSANYTFTERKEGDLFRIPKHKINSVINYQICDKTFASIDFQYSSDRTSPYLNDDFTANRILDSYTLLGFNVNREIIKDRLKVYATISNIFNEDYEELYRYTTLGRNFRLGMTLNF